MKSNNQDISLNRIELLNWLLLLILALAGWIFYSPLIGRSVFVGGLVANISFRFLRRDLTKLFRGPMTAVKLRFFILYYIRLSVVMLILFVLVKNQMVNTLGLLAGLSTVLLSMVITAVGETKKIILNIKEAS
ncbi:MAG: ATP synthase subunit I [Proteobacteria bacterium]|nr:ATP synthase subunit I [Pseudomonadota bacterium]MBU1714169.1 ATP synthase subunit I [Pseudomonadota bacterium]